MILAKRCSVLILLAALAALAAGCGKSPPTRFYALTPAHPAKDLPAPAGGGRATLGIGPVDFPAYLDRPQMVTREGGNRMALAEFDQWIEPLRDNFSRVLLENLSEWWRPGPLVGHPWPTGVQPDLQAAVEVRRFDALPGQKAVLTADWTVLDASGALRDWKSLSLEEAVSGTDPAALAAAQSRLLERFSRELALALAAIPLTPEKRP